MRILLKIYGAARKYWGYIILSTISLGILTAANLIAPRYIQRMIKLIDEYAPGTDTGLIMKEIIQLAMLLGAAYLVVGVMRYINNYYSHAAAWRFVSDLRVRLYAHMQKLSLSFYHDKQTGQLMSRITNDTNSLETVIAHAIPELIGSLALFIGVAVILFTINLKLALLTCIPIPLITIGIPVMKMIRTQHRKAHIYAADLSAALQDNLSGMKEIQVFNRQEDERARVDGISRKHVGATLKALWYSAIFHPSIAFLTSLGNVIVVGFGGYFAIVSGDLAIDEIAGFLLYLSMFYGPVSSLARIIDDLQLGIVGGERVFEILETESEVKELPGAADPGRSSGRITFEDVSFSYGNGVRVLENINFDIPENKMFALVGATGVGKTTLTSLLPRFYDPTAGRILLDGRDIRELTLEGLHRNISMVLQDVFLFHGTIRENIAYSNPAAGEDEIREAARAACILDFIEGLPDRFETIVGERGMRLSGGQKQRISIARSLLSNAPVLVLDEATSAVDTETESEIRRAIASIAGTRTMLVIAHRLSTVRSADCIIVLEDGKIAETGAHDELLAKNGIYAKLVSMQNISEI